MGIGFPIANVYLYWFKYLQEAERSPDYSVDWNKYKGWGGANEILGTKFDDWWKDHWIDLFGTQDRSAQPKYPISTKQPKTEALRLSLLCWQRRDAPVWVRGGMHSQLQNKFMSMNWALQVRRNPDMGKMNLLQEV